MDILSLAIGFLVGGATGATGTYFGNKYTDERKIKESKKAKDQFYKRLWNEHSVLLSEMKSDLTNPGFGYHREFFVLSKHWSFNTDGPHLKYYIEEHDSLEQQLKSLEGEGLIHNVTESGKNVTKYKFTNEFVEYLKCVN